MKAGSSPPVPRRIDLALLLSSPFSGASLRSPDPALVATRVSTRGAAGRTLGSSPRAFFWRKQHFLANANFYAGAIAGRIEIDAERFDTSLSFSVDRLQLRDSHDTGFQRFRKSHAGRRGASCTNFS